MNSFLQLIGTITLIIIVVVLIGSAIAVITYDIDNLIYRHKYKHRFDKSPTAKCYCKDCKKWNPENGECADECNKRRMADVWFCCFAEPADKEEIKRREQL